MFGIAEDGSQVVSFIDLGTNSVHMLAVRLYPDMLAVPVYQDKESIRLGQTLYRDGRLSAEVIERCRITVGNFVRHSRDLGAESIYCFATSAAREAENRAELIDALRSDGVDARVIPGPEEARLIRLGIFGPNGPSDRTLTIDIGGGSTEVTLGKGQDIEYIDSLRLGAVRLSFGCGVDVRGTVSDADADLLLKKVESESYHAVRFVEEHGFDRAVGSSGTLIALAEIASCRRADRDPSYLLRSELESLMEELSSMPMSKRLSVPKLGANRADIIIGGGYVALGLMRLFCIRRIEISDKGMREGMLVDHIMSLGGSLENVRESSVRKLAERCMYDRPHADKVRSLAESLSSQMMAMGLLDDDVFTEELLPYAATLHDIGEFISYLKHNIHTYTIIQNSYMLGFDYRELECIALIARYHHKKFPKAGDKLLSDLTPETADKVRRCAMVLKMADVLDRHRRGQVKAAVLERTGINADLTIVADGDVSMEAWRLEELRPDFEDLFGVRLRIHTDPAGPVPERKVL